MSDLQIVNELALEYSARFTSSEDSLLKRVARDTIASHPKAHMLSGHVQGKFLELISMAVRPKFILEIGTFTGYSALCLVKGLTYDGELHTIEVRPEEASIARKNFTANKEGQRIILHEGNALQILSQLHREWDLVFIDADKSNYIEYYKSVLPFVRKGGLILADNVLFHGQVLEEHVSGKNAIAIQAFNEYVQADEAVQNVLLTVRDGLMMIFKN